MLGMLVIYSLRYPFLPRSSYPFILALFIACYFIPLVQHMVPLASAACAGIDFGKAIIVMAMVLLLAYLGSALNELTRTLPQYRNSIMKAPLQAQTVVATRRD